MEKDHATARREMAKRTLPRLSDSANMSGLSSGEEFNDVIVGEGLVVEVMVVLPVVEIECWPMVRLRLLLLLVESASLSAGCVVGENAFVAKNRVAMSKTERDENCMMWWMTRKNL
mmetsp:Transcript_724/g.1005  ORF Transcript_724/g.1005 Transcript_724/m.1005 type:complete len:116 (-) Transcript_724:194-541(-)